MTSTPRRSNMRLSTVKRLPSKATRLRPRVRIAAAVSDTMSMSGNGEIAVNSAAQICGVTATMAVTSAPPAARLEMKPARYLAGFISSLAAGGAEVTAIVAVTPHICAAELTAISPLPLIDIVSETAAAIRTRGLKRVALLGSRFTVESRMFDRLGVDVVVPKTEEIEQIHNAYMDVLNERSTSGQIEGLRQVARTLIDRDGAEAVLLAG